MPTDTVKRARLMALHERSEEMASAVDAGLIAGLPDASKMSQALRKFGAEMRRISESSNAPPDLQDCEPAQWLLRQLGKLELCLACGSVSASKDMTLDEHARV